MNLEQLRANFEKKSKVDNRQKNHFNGRNYINERMIAIDVPFEYKEIAKEFFDAKWDYVSRTWRVSKGNQEKINMLKELGWLK